MKRRIFIKGGLTAGAATPLQQKKIIVVDTVRHKMRLLLALLVILFFLAPLGYAASSNGTSGHGKFNAITDVPGIMVGQANKDKGSYLTGTTVVYAPDGAVGSAYIPGGWPGTINTVVVQPENNPQKINSVFLSGGSYYGLSVFGGVMQWLEERHIGLQVGPKATDVDPLVTGAIVFDLGRGGDFQARPTAEFGYEAMADADTGLVTQGNAGAGTGTATGLGVLPLKGGVGTASVVLDNGIVVGAIAVVNAVGTPVSLEDCSLRGAFLEIGNEFGSYQKPSPEECAKQLKQAGVTVDADSNHPNTTIGVVATNAKLTKEQAHMMAEAAARGQATAIQPVHEINDGDSLFALSTQKESIRRDRLSQVYRAANRAFARAIVHAMLNATSVGDFKSYCEVFETAEC